VVLLSIDGLRPDAIETFAAPTLQRLAREGSYAKASTILPSSTLPSHTSMLTGQPPERHHVIWNTVLSADTDLVDAPTIFGVARAHGYRTAAFFSKPKFHPLQRPGTLDYSEAPGGWFGRWSSDRTVTDVERYLAKSQPNVLFVHLADPDTAGHGSGWMSDAYARAVGTSDRAVGRLLAAANATFGQGNFTFIVTADHGGHDKGHGTSDPRDVIIPWIAWGQAVTAGPLASTAVRTMDTAATVLWLLGIEGPTDWMGQPVITAFQHTEAADAAETAATR
jgi:predicted AlkP superfamily pyrophosphatase or phosphodiesterase